jgi:GntR family transcriptional regulator, histidine utilization repressor
MTSAAKTKRRAVTKPRSDQSAALSLHERILGDIEGRILSGEWPPGSRIPFEHELSTQYSCSRMTVNKALTQLASAGLIERRRKVGSFVMRAPSRSALLEIPDIKTEVAALGAPYRFEILTKRRRRGARADERRLEGVGAGAILEIRCRHWAGERPFCLEERLISLATVPEAAAETFAEIAPGPWLLDRAPWTNAEHRIRASAIDAQRAALLHVAEGTACLTIERRTWSGGAAVTHVTLTYPGQTHQLVARFSPTQRQAVE